MLEFQLQNSSSKEQLQNIKSVEICKTEGGKSENWKRCTNRSVNSPMVTSHISIKCLHHLCHLKCTDTFYRTLSPEAILEKTGRGKRRRGGKKICFRYYQGKEGEVAWKEGDLDCLSEPLNNNIKKLGLNWLFAEMLRIRKRGFSSGPRLPRTRREAKAGREQIWPMRNICPLPEEGPPFFTYFKEYSNTSWAHDQVIKEGKFGERYTPAPCHSIFYPTQFHVTGIGDNKKYRLDLTSKERIPPASLWQGKTDHR